MKYYIYTLKFSTPVRFGDIGGDLTNSLFTCSADTFFSALCSEVNMCFNGYLKDFIDKFKNGDIILSSLFPYYLIPETDEQDDDLHLYLPKPLLHNEENYKNIKPFSEMKNIVQASKETNNTAFIRASEIKSYLKAKKARIAYNYKNPKFAEKLTMTKVNCRQTTSLPYVVSSYKFADNAGLYFIVGFNNEDDNMLFQEIVTSLGYSGIGGKRSSGYGKYELAKEPYEIQELYAYYTDETSLAKMLTNNTSKFQMCIAPVIPIAKDIDFISNNDKKDKMYSYQLVKRTGFIYSQNINTAIKHNTIYLIAEGSCFARKLIGTMPSYQHSALTHEIYRNGMGMFVGLTL